MKAQSQTFYKKALKTLHSLMGSLTDEYYFDMYEPNFHKIQGNYTIKHKIENTKEVYCKYHPDFDIETFNKFPNHFLEKIVENDTTIYFDEKYIYLELYKILYLLDTTIYHRKYIKTSKYNKRVKANNKSLTTQKNSHKKNILPSSNIYDKGEHRLNYHYLNNLQKEKKVTKFFLQTMTLYDLEKVAMLYKEKRDNVKKTIHFLEDRLIQKTADEAILKSLGILLHYEFKNYLKIGDDDSKKYIADIMSYIFNAIVNDDEFNRYVYLISTISFFPIFGIKGTGNFKLLNRKYILIKC